VTQANDIGSDHRARITAISPASCPLEAASCADVNPLGNIHGASSPSWRRIEKRARPL
jgi:hypothetical protein